MQWRRLALDSYLRRLQEAVASATHGMTVEEFTRHPEGKWSAGEVLEHLSLTYSGTVKGFERCLQAGKPLARRSTLKDRVAAALVVEYGPVFFHPGKKGKRSGKDLPLPPRSSAL